MASPHAGVNRTRQEGHVDFDQLCDDMDFIAE
jgi:hypothetical protein